MLVSVMALLAASATAQQAPEPKARPSLAEVLLRASNHVEAMLSSATPLETLADDSTVFTPRFREQPQQRGLAWKEFAVTGAPRDPAAFDVKCTASSTTLLTRGLGDVLAGRKPPPCNLPVTCEAKSTRVAGCYQLEFDLCISNAGQPRIDGVVGGSRFFSASLSGADITPCSREAAKQAKDTGG